MQHDQLTGDIASLKQIKRRLEDAKAQGDCCSSLVQFKDRLQRILCGVKLSN